MLVRPWVPASAFGLGAGRRGGRGGPNFLFYGTVSFWGPALLLRAGLDVVTAFRVWTIAITVVGMVSGWLWCSLWGGRLGGLVGSLCFIYGPYFYSLNYARGAYPEYFAYSLYPMALYLCHRVLTERTSWMTPMLPVVLSLILGAHTLSLALLVPVLIFYCLIVGLLSGRSVGIARVGIVLLLAAVTSLPSLFSPLFELGKIAAKEQLSGKDTLETFSAIGVPWHAMFNRESINDFDILSRCLPGRLHLLGLLASLLLVSEMGSVATRRSVIVLVLGAVGALAMSEKDVAGLVLKVVPPISTVQYPWRLLGIFNLLSVAAIAAIFSSERLRHPWLRSAAATAILVLCVVTYYPSFPSTKGIGFKNASREGIRRSMTTLDHESKYMPVKAKTFETPGPNALLSAPGGQVDELPGGANDHHYKVALPSACACTFNQYWFDGWRAQVDDREVPVLKGEDGLCAFSVPEGEHQVRVYFGRTALRSAALGLSIVGWVVLAAFAFRGIFRFSRRDRSGVVAAEVP